MRHYIELLQGMTRKEIQARYKNTLFGFLWIFINPLIQMAVIGFIFKFFWKEPIENYYIYLFVGLLIWNFFSLSLTKTTPSIVNERGLIKKSKFPHSIIPLAIILANYINLVLVFALLLIPLALTHLVAWSLVGLFVFALISLLVFTSGFSLITAALDVKYRDVNFFVQALLIVWFYATPIVYSTNIIPKNIQWVWGLNPLTAIVQIAQAFLVKSPFPDLGIIAVNQAINLVIVIAGVVIFKRESKNFDDWL